MVASASRSQLNGRNPAQSLFQNYFGGLEAFGAAYNPFLKGAARAQIELMGFMSRRAQAYLEIPTRLAHCRTPQDLMNEQVRFWQMAGEEYAEYISKMMQGMGTLQAPSFGVPVDEVQSPRDYITFPETQEPQEPPTRGRERRRAA